MKPNIRKILLAVFALAFFGSASMLVYRTVQYKEGDAIYSDAEDLVHLPDLTDLLPDVDVSSGPPASSNPDASSGDSSQGGAEETPTVYVDPYANALRNMDFSALQKVNSDVLGWIIVPNTKLSYPLVQGADNDYYLNRTWKKTKNSVGAIFMQYTNKSNLSDFHTIVYGHRMNDNSMFGTLKYFSDQSYWEKHPNIYISDASGSHKYEIFAAYEVSVTADTYRLSFTSDQIKQSFLDFCAGQSVIDTGIVPTVYDRILTLSTCTGNGHATRWVVQGVLKGVAPADNAQPADGDIATSGEVIPPDASTQEPIPPDVSTQEPTLPDVSTGEPTPPDASTGEPTPPDASTGEPTPPDASTEEPTPPDASTGEPAPPDASTGEPAPPDASTGEPTPPDTSTQEPTPPDVSTGEPAPPDTSTEPPISQDIIPTEPDTQP